jgi:hypothetical protein
MVAAFVMSVGLTFLYDEVRLSVRDGGMKGAA